MPTIITQFPQFFDLSLLNGSNGFTINGVSISDWSGFSVSGAGDINADGIDDIFIGSPLSAKNAGTSYIVFGSSMLNKNRDTVDLTDLTGINGFIIDGALPGEQTGWMVCNAGDINADGITDLLIGSHQMSPGMNNSTAVGYVLFGRKHIGSSGSISLSTLNGANGFAIYGTPNDDHSGTSVSGAGDMNGDGIADLIIGSFGASPGGKIKAGKSYVVFGKSGLGSTGSFYLSRLNGTNGFSINGVSAGDTSGYSVSLGDINGDNFADLFIGAIGAVPGGRINAGITYAVFGQSDIGRIGSLDLSALNGQNGFIINGISPEDKSGYSVAGAGDVNDDGITDLIVGAPYASPLGKLHAGASYIVFGKKNIGISGTFELSNLNGINGFSIYGVLNGDFSGFSVNAAGDINGDGLSDLVIGAPNASPSGKALSGTSYLVFGKQDTNPIVDLAILGSKGIIINGISNGDFTGFSVHHAGDVNGDGIADFLIGSPTTSPLGKIQAGSSYVIFGDIPAVIDLSKNFLSVTRGQTILLNSNNINATYIAAHSKGMIFSIINLQHGMFEYVTNPGIGITSFSQIELMNHLVQFVHDNSVFAPSYSLSINDGGLASTYPQRAIINFIHLGPKLVKNFMAINQGQVLLISTNQIAAVSLDNPLINPSLIFTVNQITHGNFELVINPGVAITTFSQAQIQSNVIQFVHDGSINPPSFYTQVSEGPGGIYSDFQLATIAFNMPPVLGNHTLSISQGQTKILNSINLSAYDPDDPLEELIFIIKDTQNGRFEQVNNPGTSITSFIQSKIQESDIQFVHSGNLLPPDFSVAVSDGKATTAFQRAIVYFSLAPILERNTLNINQGQTLVIDSNNISASDPDYPAENLVFVISQIQQGRFEDIRYPKIAITQFTQYLIQNRMIQFTHDGSRIPPSYHVAVSDGKMTTSPHICTVNFNTEPVLNTNQLTINQGQTVIITPGDLSARDDRTAASELIFTALNVMHGYFEDTNYPGRIISKFPQQRIFTGALHFVADGSALAPTYNISVSNGILSTTPSTAIVNFTPSSEPAESNFLNSTFIASLVSGGMGLMFLLVQLIIKFHVQRRLDKEFEAEGTDSERERVQFQKEVIKPIAKKIFESIKTTSFLGYRSGSDTKGYLHAIERLIIRLKELGEDVDLGSMSPVDQTSLLNEIAHQITLKFIPERSCCSTAYLYSFFKPDVTPGQFDTAVDEIANAIHERLNSRSPLLTRLLSPNSFLSESEPIELNKFKVNKLTTSRH